jgi:hypothetical protein
MTTADLSYEELQARAQQYLTPPAEPVDDGDTFGAAVVHPDDTVRERAAEFLRGLPDPPALPGDDQGDTGPVAESPERT